MRSKTEHDEIFLYSFRTRIKSIIKELGYSQKQIAEKAGISEPNLSSYLSGSHEPGIMIIKKIADALSVSPALFFCDKADRYDTSSPCWKHDKTKQDFDTK